MPNVEAAALIVDHLVQLGHRHIAAIAGPKLQFMTKDRLAGFRLGLARGQLDPAAAPVANGDFSLQSGYAATCELIDANAKFTALVCANDEMAIGAMTALRERGLSVPGDVSIAGFDNLRFGAFAVPPLTTIEIPTVALGETAMQLMLDVLREPESAGREVVLPHRLIIRESTTAPSKH